MAPTNNPPLDPPLIAKKSDDVYLSAIKCSAAAMKSSKTFCFCILVPASCHFFPYSPPPRKLTATKTPPISSQTAFEILKLGVRLTLNPPYP
ncbi:hypothetical protein D3C86_928170 [compost metagenome]